MLAALDYHFKENGADYSLLKDSFPESTFERSRLVNGKAIELRESGKGKRKNKADPLTLRRRSFSGVVMHWELSLQNLSTMHCSTHWASILELEESKNTSKCVECKKSVELETQKEEKEKICDEGG